MVPVIEKVASADKNGLLGDNLNRSNINFFYPSACVNFWTLNEFIPVRTIPFKSIQLTFCKYTVTLYWVKKKKEEEKKPNRLSPEAGSIDR